MKCVNHNWGANQKLPKMDYVVMRGTCNITFQMVTHTIIKYILLHIVIIYIHIRQSFIKVFFSVVKHGEIKLCTFSQRKHLVFNFQLLKENIHTRISYIFAW